jgi:predicted unusual protein kinase regulating ubiquinone biosynthesis (AarF/ABC1/UbiB family)
MIETASSETGREPRQSGRFRRRYSRVMRFFIIAVAQLIFWEILLRRVGLRRLSRSTAERRYRRLAGRFRSLATDLGGVWIKVGQFLSARVDILPQSITDELSELQDEVPPEPFESVRPTIEGELGSRLDDLFEWMDSEPLAAASLGQVHRARLRSGEAVVVKVQRADIHSLVEVDLSALKRVIGWLKRYRPVRRRADLDALYQEFSRTLWEELDYVAEAANARRFGEMFAEDPGVRIPWVDGPHSTARVLTLEDVYFIKITDYDAIEGAGLDRVKVADRLFRTYLRQIFIEGFFHADPHPGNLFVEALGEDEWRLVFVDFGMVGRLGPEVTEGLKEMAIGVGARDPDRLIQAYQTLGVLLPGADLERIRQAEAALFDQLWGKSMSELARIHPREMSRFTRQFRDLMVEMPFQVPTDLIFLGRCVAILSGMCTGLNPEFNLFQGLAPFAQRLVADQRGSWLEVLLDRLATEGLALASIPSRLGTVLSRLERGQLVVMASAAPDLERSLGRLTRTINRLVMAVLFAALLLGGALLYISGERLIGGIGFGLAVLAFVWAVRS